MSFCVPRPVRRICGAFLMLTLAALPAFSPGLEAAQYLHGTLGRIDVYTSDSEENTRELVAELLEVRRQMQQLVAPVPLPNPRMQLLVFNRLKDYHAFLPDRPVTDSDLTTISGFTVSEFGLVGAMVKEGYQGYQFGRESLRYFYAAYLLHHAVPQAPIWVRAGLPDFLAATDCRKNRIRLGADFMKHRDHVPRGKFTPLAELMDDAAMRKYFPVSRHDNTLYHESWALWHQWLSTPNPRRREQVPRLFAAIRKGRPGDLALVAEAFGESGEQIEAARRPPVAPRGFPIFESNPDAGALVRGMAFAPATAMDLRFAQALLTGGTGKGPGVIGAELYRLADSDPTSPRPAEALAILAMGEKDFGGAAQRWITAREKGTDNPYAYLLPLRQALDSRPIEMSCEAQVSEMLCATWRGYAERCTEFDPGCADAWYYRALIEAVAPSPNGAVLDAVEASQTLDIRPAGYTYLAIARWRNGQRDAARQLLRQAREYQPPLGMRAEWLDQVEATMKSREAATN